MTLLSGKNPNLNPDRMDRINEICDFIERSRSSSEVKGRACYLSGLRHVILARRSGELQKLWSGSSNDEERSETRRQTLLHLQNAKVTLNRAWVQLGAGNDVWRRNCSRLLALVLGPDEELDGSGISAHKLLNYSTGRDSRDLGVVEEWSGDLSVFDKLNQPTWKVLCCALTPTGEMMLSGTFLGDGGTETRYSTICVFPESDASGDYVSTIYESMIEPLDSIVCRAEQQLNGGSIAPTTTDKEDTDKKAWWDFRKGIEGDLQSLLESVDGELLHCGYDSVLPLGERPDSTCGDLTSRFDAACSVNDSPAPLVTTRSRRSRGRQEKPQQKPSKQDEEVVLLILDENLSRFPFENLDALSNTTVCRVPSLGYVIDAMYKDNEIRSIDPLRCHFVLDPESNLSGTVDRLEPVLRSLSSSHGGDSWQGVVRAMPDEDFVRDGLQTEEGLWLYIGHGGGEKFFRRSQIEDLAKQGGVNASVLLMGCSSGRLESVNRKGSEAPGWLPIHFDPEGVSLAYLHAGAPCVIGNLWDVTDRDIDRFAVALLEKFLEGNKSLARCVAEARSSCKLRYAVGAAPVYYGMPVYLAKR